MPSSSTSSSSVDHASTEPLTMSKTSHARHLAKISLFLLGLMIVDFGLGSIIQVAYSRSTTGKSSGLPNGCLQQGEKQLVVFGNSRARHHFDTKVLKSETGKSVFNFGSNGQFIYYHRMMQKLLLQRGTDAELFVLQCDPLDLHDAEREHSIVLAPLIDEGDSEVLSIMSRCCKRVRVKNLLKTWRYNSMLVELAASLAGKIPAGDDGYIPLHSSLANRSMDVIRERAEKNAKFGPATVALQETIQMYDDFIESAHQRGIDVVMVTGPLLVRYPEHETPYRRALEDIAQRHGVPLVCLEEDRFPQFADPSLYNDPRHLNAKGATVYSELLASELKPLMQRFAAADGRVKR